MRALPATVLALAPGWWSPSACCSSPEDRHDADRAFTLIIERGALVRYVVRFALGGAATVFTGLGSSRLVVRRWGTLSRAPAIFCARATLIEKHEIRKSGRLVLPASAVGSRRPLSILSAPRWERWACWRSRRSFG